MNAIGWNGPVGAQGRRVVEGISIEKTSNALRLENIKTSVGTQLELLNTYTTGDGHCSQIGNVVVDIGAKFDASLIQETRICGEVGVVARLGEVDCELEPKGRTRKPLSHLEKGCCKSKGKTWER